MSAAVLTAAVVAGVTSCSVSVSPAASAPSTSSSAARPTTSAAAPTTEAAAEDMEGADAAVTEVPVDPGEQAVDGAQLADQVSSQLAKVVGRAPESVTCPDLPATVGAEVRCTLEDSGDTYGVTVTATSVQGSDVGFDILVDAQPS